MCVIYTVIPKVCATPPDIADQEELPIGTGDDLVVVVPSPSCPLPLFPRYIKLR
jgi:hypothetical protein